MATRSSSNKGTDRRALNVPPPARNTQDNTQAVRRIPGMPYGEQQELTQQQQAAPLPKATTPQAQPVRPTRPMPQLDVFAETQRPNEPVTSGLPFGPGVGPTEPIADDPDMLLRAIYSVYPDPLLLRLLRGKGV
tara:strand:- start:3177 stop:3578 length:402 start_codon:yes stop_codon:yes gene_type:complete